MNRRPVLILIVALGAVTLGGCQTSKEQQGQVIGAIAGGLLGNQVGGGTGRRQLTQDRIEDAARVHQRDVADVRELMQVQVYQGQSHEDGDDPGAPGYPGRARLLS